MAVAIVVLGCGDNAAPRLRARYRTGGGVRQLIGFHDTKLDLDCTFDIYVSGRDHLCIPDGTEIATDFADSKCTMPLISGSATYVEVPAANACTGQPKLFMAGSGLAGVQSQLSFGTCGAPLPMHPVRAEPTTVPISDSMFAAAHEVGTSDGQLLLVTDDGGAVPWGGWDGQRAVMPVITPAGFRWAPWIDANLEDFAFTDPACSTPIATVDKDVARCPIDAVVDYPDDYDGPAGTPLRFFALGSAVTRQYQIITSSSGSSSCEADRTMMPQLLFDVGSAIDPTTLPDAFAKLVGDGPLRQRVAVMNGHEVLQTGVDPHYGGIYAPAADTFVDGESGLDCFPGSGSDGVTRCFPAADQELVFLDSACLQQVVPIYGSAVPPLYAYVADDNGSIAVNAVAGSAMPPPATMYYGDQFGECVAGGGVPYAQLGSDVPASRFVEMTIEIE